LETSRKLPSSPINFYQFFLLKKVTNANFQHPSL